MALAKLSIEIEAELAKFKQSLDGVGAEVQRHTAGWAKSFGPLTAAFTALTASVSAAGFLALAKGATDSLDALNDLRDATGASIGNISALEDLALRTGGSLETVETSLLRLNAALKDTDPDSRAAKALQAIGISAMQLQKEDPAEALRQVAAQLGRFADDGNKARLIQELFGKSSKEVAAFLHDLSEKQKLVATTGDDSTAAAERFNRELFEMQTNISQLARDITGDLLPALNSLVDDFKTGNFGFLGLGGEEYEARKKLEHLRGLAQDARDDLERAAQSSAPARLLFFGSTSLADIEQRAKDAQKAVDLYLAQYIKLSDAAGAGRGFLNPDAIKPSVGDLGGGKSKTAKAPRSMAPVISEFDRYLAQLQQAQIRVADLSALEQAQYDIALGKLGELNYAQQALVLTEAHRVDAARDVAEVQREWVAAFDELDRRQQTARDQAAQVWQSLLTPAERYAEQLQKIKTLVDGGAFGDPTDPAVRAQIDELNKRTAQLDPKVVEAADKAKTLAQESAGFFKDLVHNINDADDVLLKFLSRLADRALNDTFDHAGNWLAGLLQGGSSGGGLLSAIGAFLGGAYADGGRPPLGKISLVGERGPELFVPDGAGTIVPLKPARAGSGGGPVINISPTYHIGQGVNRSEVAAAVQAGNQQLRADIARQLRHGKLAGG